MKKILFFSVVLFFLACKQGVENDASSATIQANYMTANAHSLPIYHTFLEIYDTVQIQETKYFIDSVGNALQEKFLFVDARNEVRGTFNPDEVNMDRIHPNFPYIMQVHVKQAPKSGDFHLIQVQFTHWGMPFVRLAKSASIVTGGGTPNTSFFADCADPTPGCRAKFNLKRIAEFCFTQVAGY